jgi:hypothetical protein
MALGQSRQKSTVFLSFAGEDSEWKRTLMEPRWWAALTKVADIYDYDSNPNRSGDINRNIDELIKKSAAFIVILSKYYLKKDGIVEREFTTAAECFATPNRQDLFQVIIIDSDAKQWWDGRLNALFQKHEYLKSKIYWELIENNGPAIVGGDLKPQYARKVRDYAETMAASITTWQAQAVPAVPINSGSIIVLGHPKESTDNYAAASSGVVRERKVLVETLRARNANVSQWEDGWLLGNGDKQEVLARALHDSVNAVVRPVDPDEAVDIALSPEVITNQLSYATGQKMQRAEVSKIKTSLWLPLTYRDDPKSKFFVEKAGEQPADANPKLRVAATLDLAELLVPSSGRGKITQISVEALDDIREIENGRTARKIVEDELHECFMDGARQANLDMEPPLVRQFLNYERLANQIAEAKGDRIMLVAHDLQEHLAASPPEAHRMLGRKVRNLRESVEDIIVPRRGQFIPITLVVTNYKNLRNDIVLDEEIAGIKWWLLSGQLAGGKFSPEPDVYAKVVDNIARMLQ